MYLFTSKVYCDFWEKCNVTYERNHPKGGINILVIMKSRIKKTKIVEILLVYLRPETCSSRLLIISLFSSATRPDKQGFVIITNPYFSLTFLRNHAPMGIEFFKQRSDLMNSEKRRL